MEFIVATIYCKIQIDESIFKYQASETKTTI